MKPTGLCGKINYRSKATALVAASISLRFKDCNTATLRAYYHSRCHAWHLTKKEEVK